MKKYLLLLPLLASLLPLTRGVITNNIPISGLPITTNVLDTAYFPLIQPYPGRTTNDTMRATTADIFNGRSTGSFTNITVNNLTVVSNLFLTNVTVQEFNTTNIIDNSVTYITNSFLVISNTTVTINGTNVATINPTVGRIPYNLDGTNFADSALFYIDPDTVGATEIDAGLVAITNLANDTFLVTRTIGGIDGVITNGPAIADLTLWTNSGGYLQPIDLTTPLFWTNSVTWGPGTTNIISRQGVEFQFYNDKTPTLVVTNSFGNAASLIVNSDVLILKATGTSQGVGLQDASAREVRYWVNQFFPEQADTGLGADAVIGGYPFGQIVGLTNKVYGFFEGGNSTNYSRLDIYHSGTNGSIVLDSQSSGSAGSPRSYQFDMGGTNLASLSRNSVRSDFTVTSPDGVTTTSIGSDNSLTSSFASSGVVNIYGSGFNLVANNQAFLNTTLTIDLGEESFPWQDLWLGRTAYVSGYDGGTGTDYSRLAISHTSTNGAVVFDSQASGSAGIPRPFDFTGSDLRQMGYPLGASDFPMLAASHTGDCYWTNIHATSLTTGTNTIFTVPSNYRLNARLIFVIPSTNNTPYVPAVGISGTTYRLAGSSTIQTNGSVLNTSQYIYEGGETVQIIASGAATDAFFCGLLYTNTIPYATHKLTSLSVGTNYVYTVPTGKYAVGRSGGGASFTTMNYVNGSAGSIGYELRYLLSGETSGTKFLGGSQSTLAGTGANCAVLVMQPGDAFVINVDANTAGQIAWVTVFENP